MPSNTNPKASNAGARDYSNYAWVAGKNARFDAVCLHTDPDTGRVSLGIKGWDSRAKAPGFIMVDLTAVGLQDIATLTAKALAGKVAA